MPVRWTYAAYAVASCARTAPRQILAIMLGTPVAAENADLAATAHRHQLKTSPRRRPRRPGNPLRAAYAVRGWEAAAWRIPDRGQGQTLIPSGLHVRVRTGLIPIDRGRRGRQP